MIDLLKDLFSYTFIIRALVGGGFIALCAALLGVNLVLKRFSMIGDGLSHVGFGTLAIAMALNFSPLAVSIPVVVASAFLLLRIGSSSDIKGDAAVALLSSSALALGILVTSLTSGLNTDVTAFMFGSILAMSRTDMYISIALGIVVISLYTLLYNRIFAVTFDETFSSTAGLHTGRYNSLLAILTALTVAAGMRFVGVMMISSLIIFPALSAMRIFKTYRPVVICSALFSVLCFFIGIIASFVFSAPAGASIVTANLICFGICALIGFIKK